MYHHKMKSAKKVQQQKKAPDNTGKQYFKWNCETRIMLLQCCLDKEVWTHVHGSKMKIFQDVCTVLQTIPNHEESFSKLNWRKCQTEFDTNLALYKADQSTFPFNSGTAEDHTRWHDVMEEIACLETQHSEKFSISREQSNTDLQKDPKTAGELVTFSDYTTFLNNRSRANNKRPKLSRQQDVQVVYSDVDVDSYKPPILTPTDRLATALALKLESDLKKEKETSIQSAPVPPPHAQSNQAQYYVSSFQTIQEMLQLVGTTDHTVLETYASKLIEFGFDTPQLMLGINGEYDLLIRMGFKVGHALRLLKVIAQFVDDIDG